MSYAPGGWWVSRLANLNHLLANISMEVAQIGCGDRETKCIALGNVYCMFVNIGFVTKLCQQEEHQHSGSGNGNGTYISASEVHLLFSYIHISQ